MKNVPLKLLAPVSRRSEPAAPSARPGRHVADSITRLVVLLTLLLPGALMAQVAEDFLYTVNQGANTIRITGYTGAGGAVIIPAKIPDTPSGLPVTQIGSYAFSAKTRISSVSIPDSVWYIEDRAFSDCTGLRSLNLGSGVTYIGPLAFVSCTALTSVSIPDSVKRIGDDAFNSCRMLTRVSLGSGVTTIESYAFYGCTGLTSVIIPDSLNTIGDAAFGGCTMLSSVYFPGNASVALGTDVFSSSDNVTVYYLPGTTGWTATFAGRPTAIFPFTYATNDSQIIITGYTGTTNMVAIPATIESLPVTTIGINAFANRTGLTSVDIPDSVTSIEHQAFAYCSDLTSVGLGSGVTTIGGYAFYYCDSITRVTIPDSITSIGGGAFQSCIGLTRVYIAGNAPGTVGTDVFLNANNVSVYYQPGTTGWGATFAERPTVRQSAIDDFVYSSDGVNLTITDYRGAGAEVIIPDMINGLPVTSIGTFAFNASTGLMSVSIPDSITTIGLAAFYACADLTSVSIPDSVTSIGDGAFLECTDLTSVSIPDSISSIGESAFGNCISLTSVSLGSGVTTIGQNAFSSCTVLTSVYFAGNVPGTVGTGVFDYANNVTVYYLTGTTGWGATFAGQPTVMLSANADFYYTSDGTHVTISVYTGAGGAVIIPDMIDGLPVTSIGINAFRHCTGLTNITVDAANTNYGSADGVLFNKTLTTLIQYPEGKIGSYTIPDSVTVIGNQAFINCTGLTSVSIGNGVTSIGEAAFYACTSLTNATIGSGVTSIGNKAFENCTVLTSVIIPDSVTVIGDFAFDNCISLTRVSIGNGVTSIREYTFAKCTGLTSVLIPDSVTSISNAAFFYCTGLSSVYFQGNAPSIASAAFSGTTATVYYLPGTTGWGATFAGRPTVLWNPKVANTGTAFGVQGNAFGFDITGPTGAGVVVEATTDLASPDWTPVGSLTLTGGNATFSDPQWTNHPRRFYRLRMP